MKKDYTENKSYAERLAKELLKKEQEFIPGTEEHTFVLWMLRKRFPVLTDLPDSEPRLSTVNKLKKELPWGYYYPDGDFPDDIPLKSGIKPAGKKGGASVCFWYKDPKNEFNEWTDFSYKATLLETPEKRRERNLEKTFREIIVDQLAEFKRQELSKPENKTLKMLIEQGKVKMEVDHTPPFCQLRRDFLRQENLEENTLELIPCYPLDGYTFAIEGLDQKWWQYHKNHATLSLIDANENRRKGAS